MSKRARRITIPGVAGINGRQDRGAAPFQPGQSEGGGWRPLALVKCENAVVADDGAVLALPAAERIDGADGVLALHAAPCGLLLQRDGGLWRLGDATPLVADVSASVPIQFQSHQGLVYWFDDSRRGRITSTGLNLPWALPQAATPTVTSIAGTMPAGRYLVSVTWLDITGAESGCAPSFEATLTAPGALRIAVGTIPADVAMVRVYVSPPNGQHPAWVADVATSAFPYDVTAAHEQTGTKSLIVVRTQGLSPMPVGDGMTTRGGFLLTWSGAVLWFSAGSWSHLCDVSRNLFVFPSSILGAVGLDGGVWVITSHAAYWIDGADLSQARIVPVTARRAYASGGLRVSAADAFGVQTSHDVAVFASSEGPVVGTADGQLVAPLADSQLWDVAGKSVQIVPFEQGGTRLIALNLVEVL